MMEELGGGSGRREGGKEGYVEYSVNMCYIYSHVDVLVTLECAIIFTACGRVIVRWLMETSTPEVLSGALPCLPCRVVAMPCRAGLEKCIALCS